MTHLVTVLGGDGIGPEVTKAAVRVCEAVTTKDAITWTSASFGGQCFYDQGSAFPGDTQASCRESTAVLLGAVGLGELPPGAKRPELGLLELRGALGTFANIRPVKPFPSLFAMSPLRPELLENVDILFVRELTGGLYFGEKTRTPDKATDMCVYTKHEIERIVTMASQYCSGRSKRLTSVDKANVLETSRLWREVSTETVARVAPDVALEHLLVDAMAMYLLKRPADFDVIVTENMFGDILTDEASMLCGSLGMLPSASIGEGTGLYEPIHGSAPDIVGQGIANPCGTILSAAMMLRMSLDQPDAATAIEKAVEATIDAKVLTPDLGGKHSTTEMTDEVIKRLG